MTAKDQKNPQEPDKRPCLSTYKFDTSKYVVFKDDVYRDPKTGLLVSSEAEKKNDQAGQVNERDRK